MRNASQDDQIPWFETSLTDPYFLIPPEGTAIVAGRSLRTGSSTHTRQEPGRSGAVGDTALPTLWFLGMQAHELGKLQAHIDRLQVAREVRQLGILVLDQEALVHQARQLRLHVGGGLRLQNSNPMMLEDVAIAFPDMQIVIAHPSWPWQDEALSLALHKPNVWIDLSGWSPKYFPKQLVQYANTLLKDRVLFGSDYPLITPERWMKDFEVAGFKPEVMPGILKDNAVRLLGLA